MSAPSGDTAMNPAPIDYCPRCGKPGIAYHDGKYWACPACGFVYYHNVAASASVIIEHDGFVVMLRRNRDPAKGLLALPGGFVDPDERAEDAAVRECREETGLAVTAIKFVGSWPNTYTYRDVWYKTCDLYFSAVFSGDLSVFTAEAGEVSSLELVAPADFETAPIAFESARRALIAWRDGQ